MAALSLMPLDVAARQIGILPAQLLTAWERGIVPMAVVGSGPTARHYVQTGDVERLGDRIREAVAVVGELERLPTGEETDRG